jgi:hypothetical protein
VATKRNQHAQRNPVQHRERHDAVHRRKEAVVLHEEHMALAREVRTRGDTDGLFFLGHLNQPDVGILLGQLQQKPEPRLGQRRQRRDASILDALKDDLRVLVRNGHGRGAVS